MVDFVALVTPPILAGPDMKPANGDIYIRSTNTVSKSGLVVVPFQAHGKIIDGTFKALDGGPLYLVVTPEGVALEIHAEIVQESPGGSRSKYRISRTVSTPNQATVTWDALLDAVPVESGTEYAIPAWVTQLLNDAVAAGPIALDAADRAEAAAASLPTSEELSANIATAVATRAKKFQVDVTEHGAVGDFNGTTGTDNLAAFNAALAACAVGGTVFVPPGRYYFSDTFVIDKTVDFNCGRGGFAANAAGTQLVFAAGKGGLWVKKNAGGVRPSGWRVGPFEIQSLSTAAGTDVGVLATDGQGTLDFTTVNGFGSHGFAFLAGANSPYTTGNVNNSYLNRPRAYGNRGDGILIQGNDSQACIVIKADVVANYGIGINLSRTAHTEVIAPHADHTVNGSLYAFRDDGNGNKWEWLYSEGGVGMLIDTNSNWASITTTQYARPVITDNSSGKTALRVDVEQGTFKQSMITGVSGSRAAFDVDQFASGAVRLRQILNAGVAAAKDIFMYAAGSNTFSINAPIRVNGTAATTPQLTSGAGAPEGVVTAPPGSFYLRTDGAAGTSAYSKATGTGNTGWAAV